MALPPSPDLPRRGAHRKHGQETEGARRRLHGKVAIVAGGLSGIGAAIAGRIAAEGVRVIAADLATEAGPQVAPLPVDVTEEASTDAMPAAALAAHDGACGHGPGRASLAPKRRPAAQSNDFPREHRQMTMTFPRASRRTLLLGAGVLALPTVARAQTQYRAEYKLSVVGNRPIPLSEGAFQWADLVTQRSGGRINVKVYPGSQLVGGDQTRELVAMRQGVIDMAVFSTINISPQVREMNVFSLPFLLRDHRGFDAIINGEVGQDLFRVLSTREVVPVAWGENGFRELSNSKREVRRPEDLRGMKIRFAAGAIFSEIFTAMGANPLQMSFADLQPALSTGAVDGQENPVNLFLAFRMDTLAQKHLTIWNYVADAGIFVVGKQMMDSLAPADRDLVIACAREAAAKQIEASRKGTGIGGDRSALEECARRGVAVAELTAAEKEAFARVTRPVYDKWAQTVGSALVEKAQAAINRAIS